MDKEQILHELEDLLDLESNTLTLDSKLSEIGEYDSMAKLAIIVFSDDEFDKKLSGEQIRAFQTIGDIVAFLLD
jgi:acyl carrier protein